MLKSPARARVARRILQGMGLVYLIAFVSLALQIDGLYGSRGILPVADFLGLLTEKLGPSAWQQHPTLFWLGSGDLVLQGVCWAGAVASLGLLLGAAPMLSALVCWALYFSLFQVGRVFLSFQWDILLLEAGFLTIFLAPLRLRSRRGYHPEPSAVVVWMLRWLLFRLMFASGFVKLLSGDPSWWNLTALHYHYWTQPLPTWTAWLASQLPSLLHRASVFAMFVVELGLPWFIFGPRQLRLVAFVGLVSLQILIAATGNYTYFNLLTVVLCFSLLDDEALDAVWSRIRPGRSLVGRWPDQQELRSPLEVVRLVLAGILALPLATAGGALMVARFVGFEAIPPPVAAIVRAMQPWQVTSSYGLFAAMTKDRREIILEGSVDGQKWREYEMRWKPGDVARAPLFVAPHQPRLDWQMWFAALGDWRRSPWLVNVERRLLEGSPSVISLFDSNPFEGNPPRYIRAVLYEYRFTDWTTHEETGAWWTRRRLGPFSPTLSR